MTVDWLEVWQLLDASFRAVALAVQRENSSVQWRSGRTQATNFPFGAFLSFSDGAPADEEILVVSVDCKQINDSLEMTSDIAKGNGEVLFDGPSARFDGSMTDLEYRVVLIEWSNEIQKFLSDTTNDIVEYLTRPPDSTN